MSAVVAYWPVAGVLWGLTAFPVIPSLRDRGARDDAGDLYQQWFNDGWLQQWGNRVTDNRGFLKMMLRRLQDTHNAEIIAIAHDRWREIDVIEATGVEVWSQGICRIPRGVNAGASTEGSAPMSRHS